MTDTSNEYGLTPLELEQQSIEEDMVRVGIERFNKSTQRLEDAGHGATTSYGISFIKSVLIDVADAIYERQKQAKEGATKFGKFWHLISPLEAEVISYIALREIMDNYTKPGSVLATIVRGIGTKVQDEIKFRAFEVENKEHMSKIRTALAKRGSTDYQHAHKVITANMNNVAAETGRNSSAVYTWTQAETIHIGAAILDVVIETTGHFTKVVRGTSRAGRPSKVSTLQPSDELLDWITSYKDRMGLLFPSFMPCVVPPMDWEKDTRGIWVGGFWTQAAQHQLPLVINKGKNGNKPVAALRAAKLGKVTEALNHLQKTAWRVNTEVLDTLKQVAQHSLGVGMPRTEKIVPPDFPFSKEWKIETATEEEALEFKEWKHFASLTYTAEKERVSKALLLSRILSVASKYDKYDSIYFVWHVDFRGRMYSASNGLSPQSNDVSKGLLHFAKGEPLDTPESVFWWKVHGGNCFGVDKLTYEERVKWVDENDFYLKQAGTDPLACTDFWGVADKPYQFLAWCFEYAKYNNGKNTEFLNYIPVALDGSCNGLQHFSAMLRDEVGGKSVNLTPMTTPQDIYRAVAARTSEKILAVSAKTPVTTEEILAHKIAGMWAGYTNLNRSMVKRCVMTLPYGSTRASARDYLFQHYIESDGKLAFKEAGISLGQALNFMTAVVWEAIGEIVIAARAAMDWLRQVAAITAKKNLALTWTSQSGFVIHQAIKKVHTKVVQTLLCGRTEVNIGITDEEILDSQRQRNGVAPNFVHGCDAAHLVATIVTAKAHSIQEVSAIHDDYGVHARFTHLFHGIIRSTFVEQYSESVLQQFKDEIEASTGLILPPLPATGDLDLEVVKDSLYFFG